MVSVTVEHPRLPVGRIWLPIPSLMLYVAAWVVRAASGVVWKRWASARPAAAAGVDRKLVGRALTRAAWVLLCSGSYVLCDVRVPGKRLRVRIRVV